MASYTGLQNCSRSISSEGQYHDIPWKDVEYKPDLRFQHADPGRGKPGSEIWHTVKVTTMVVTKDAGKYGLSGGGSTWQDEKDFDETTQAFLPTVMHDMHCVILIKGELHNVKNGSTIDPRLWEHLFHCTERLRLSVLCHGDMTLERPQDITIWPQNVPGWGESHRCRDQEKMISAIKRDAVFSGAVGYRRATPEDFTGLVPVELAGETTTNG